MSTETKTYSLAEVAKHNSNKSVWFVIHNNIYDVTEFLNEVRDVRRVHMEIKQVMHKLLLIFFFCLIIIRSEFSQIPNSTRTVR